MFGIWWTPVHKKEFVALWASLTNANNQVRLTVYSILSFIIGLLGSYYWAISIGELTMEVRAKDGRFQCKKNMPALCLH